MAFIPDAAPTRFIPDDPNAVIPGRPKPKADAKPAEAPSPGVGDIIKGVGDAALSGASKVATGVVGSGVGLINRLVAAASGGDGQAASDAAHDYVNRNFGYDTQTPVGRQIGQAATDLAGGAGGNLIHAAGDLVQRGADAAGIPHDFTHSQLSEASDLANVVPIGGGVVKGAAASTDAAAQAARNTAIEANRPIPLTDIQSALDAVGYKRPTSKNPNATTAQKVGTAIVGEESLPAGQSLTDQAIHDRLARHDANVPADQELNYANLAKARQGPAMGQIFENARQQLPETLTQDEQLQNELKGVGDGASQLPRSPDVEAVKQTMLDQPTMNRDQLFANMSEARDRAAALRAGAHPDKDALADAYMGISNAYENYLGRQLRDNPGLKNPVDLDQFQAARTAYAKNYDVQNALQGTSVDASKIGATQRKNPNLLTGGLQLIAEQANRNPLSSAFGPRTLATTGMGSSGSVAGQGARTAGRYVGGGLGAGAGYLLHGAPGGGVGAGLGAGVGDLAVTGLQNVIRRALTGTPASGEAAANAAINDPRLSNFFNPEAPEAPPGPLQLHPPPGQAFTPNQPTLATGAPTQRDFFGTGADHFTAGGEQSPVAPGLTIGDHMANRTAHVDGTLQSPDLFQRLMSDIDRRADADPPAVQPPNARPGDISLADVLSHGVEQRPPPGLSVAPMGAPDGGGLTFHVDPGHAAGDLSLADTLAPAAGGNNADLAAVQSVRVADQTLGTPRQYPAASPTPGSGALDLPVRPGLSSDELSLGDHPTLAQLLENNSDHGAARSALLPDRTIGAERTLPKDSPTPGSGALDLPVRPGLSSDELSLAHEPTLADILENLTDHAGVRMQGVPENILQRGSKAFRPNRRDVLDMNLSDLQSLGDILTGRSGG